MVLNKLRSIRSLSGSHLIILNFMFLFQLTITKIFTLVQALVYLYIWAFLRQVYQTKLWKLYLIFLSFADLRGSYYGHSGKLQRLAYYKATRLYKIIQKLIQVA